MTEPPPMVPNAEERLETEPAWLHDGRALYLDTGVVRLLDRAYRDGFAVGVQVERARIVAALREPSDELADLMRKAIDTDRVEDVLRALADHLEHQPATPADRGEKERKE